MPKQFTLRELRDRLGLSQEQFGALIGRTKGAVSQLEASLETNAAQPHSLRPIVHGLGVEAITTITPTEEHTRFSKLPSKAQLKKLQSKK